MAVYIGTAGWSYPRGAGKWDSVFYPKGLPNKEKLAYYAERLGAVEINNSFYRPLDPESARSWVNSTPPEFRFCTKLYNKFTHPKMFRQAGGKDNQVSEADYEAVKHGLEPLAKSGKLGALLVQFPPSFKAGSDALDSLEELLQRFSEYPLAVELRHRTWSDQPQGRNLLEEYGTAWVVIDEPKFKTSVRDIPLTSRLGYLRFHGRNYQEWWRGDNESRYNYLYSPQEQAALASEVREIAEKAADTYAFYNNHYRAKAVVNALQLKHELGEPIDAELSPELMAEYPDLEGIRDRKS
jgi:uncharacterized protein YecE (DUF72 family)